MKARMERDNVFRGVTFACLHATLIADDVMKSITLDKTSRAIIFSSWA